MTTASLLSLCVKVGRIWFTAVVAGGKMLLSTAAGRGIRRRLSARCYLYHHVTPALQLTLAESTPPLLHTPEGCDAILRHLFFPKCQLVYLFIKYYT